MTPTTPAHTRATQAALAHLPAQLDWQHSLYRHFHAHPELSYAEHATAARIEEELTGLGLTPRRIAGTGVLVTLTNGDGPTVLARADTDALPVTEDTGLDYTSTNPGVMHACAHDMHITALLGTVRLLHENRGTWAGTFTALFQPAEELNNGAQTVVDDGLVAAIPAPDVALAQHILPTRAGAVGIASGPVLSAADSLKITILGRGGHGSMPHKTVDPVVIAGAIIMRLQTVVSRETQPGEFAVLTIGAVQAGTKANIIADTAELLVSVRSYAPETRERILTAIDRIVRAECTAAGAPDEPLIELYETTPVTSNDPDHALRLEGVFKDAFGAEVYRTEPITASEDFGIIPDALGVPYVYWFVGGTDADLYDEAAAAGTLDELPSNHSPFFAPAPTPTLERATEAMTVAVMSYLGV